MPPYILLVIDDAHHLAESGRDLFGSLLQVAEITPLRLLFISRTTMTFYDRRDVLTRNRMGELAIPGLSEDVVKTWLEEIDVSEQADASEVHRLTGGHPLALELLEMYGDVIHGDWLSFLDQEILNVLPSADQRGVSLVVPCGFANENYMKPNTFLIVSKNDDSGNPNFAGRNLNFQ